MIRLSTTLAALLIAAGTPLATTTADARWRGPEISLFSAPNYRGASITFTQSDPDLGRNGFNDRAQSLRARGNWLLCRGRYFRQQCVPVTGNMPDLRRIGMNRAAGSVRRR